MQKCLITGASGLLGRTLFSYLLPHYDLIGLYNKNSLPDLLHCDLTDADALKALVVDVQPDIVIHCAAWRDPDLCETYPAQARNINVAPIDSFCKYLPVNTRLVLISSDYVFNGESPPYSESDKVCPVNVYGETKAAAERLALSRENSLVIRPPLLVGSGPALAESGFISQILESLNSDEQIRLDDVLVRFPTWVMDVCAGIGFLLSRGETGIYHISSDQGGTRYQLTRAIGELLNLPVSHLIPSTTIIRRKAKRPFNSQLSNTKIKELGFNHITGFSEVVMRVLKDFGELTD